MKFDVKQYLTKEKVEQINGLFKKATQTPELGRKILSLYANKLNSQIRSNKDLYKILDSLDYVIENEQGILPGVGESLRRIIERKNGIESSVIKYKKIFGGSFLEEQNIENKQILHEGPWTGYGSLYDDIKKSTLEYVGKGSGNLSKFYNCKETDFIFSGKYAGKEIDTDAESRKGMRYLGDALSQNVKDFKQWVKNDKKVTSNLQCLKKSTKPTSNFKC